MMTKEIMTRIDFYILKNQPASARLRFACRLLQKAYQQQHKVYVHLESEAEAAELDQRLWTFHDESFIPHALVSAANVDHIPILLGTNAPQDANDILLNLAPDTAGFFPQFQRIMEIVPAEEPWQSQARTRYRDYQEKQYAIQTHTIMR